MANGFFLGGVAEGAMAAQQQALKERVAEADIGLRGRGLDLQERQFANTVSQQAQAEADKRIAETMAVASDTIKAGLEGGADPAKIRQTVMPLVASAQAIAQRIGRDPAALAAQVDAQLTAPTPVARAGVTGTAAAAQKVAEAKGIAAATGEGIQINPFKTEKERVDAENSLRDDYVARSKDFVIQRDFMDRIVSAPSTGAGDVGLVFSYMKVLDPTSTVREGEFATAKDAPGVPASIIATYNRLIGGGLLSDTARREIRDASQKFFSKSAARHNALTNQFSSIAKRQGLRVNNVIVDFTAGGDAPASGTTSTGINWNLK